MGATKRGFVLDGIINKLQIRADGTGEEALDAHLLLLARAIVGRRSGRAQFLPAEIFGEPAWDMLLDLFIASGNGTSISVSSACIASRAPATTALRWLKRMEELGLVERLNDDHDRRRVFVRITERAKSSLASWLISQ